MMLDNLFQKEPCKTNKPDTFISDNVRKFDNNDKTCITTILVIQKKFKFDYLSKAVPHLCSLQSEVCYASHANWVQ